MVKVVEGQGEDSGIQLTGLVPQPLLIGTVCMCPRSLYETNDPRCINRNWRVKWYLLLQLTQPWAPMMYMMRKDASVTCPWRTSPHHLRLSFEPSGG